MQFGLTSFEFLFLLPIVVSIYYFFPKKIRVYWLLFVNVFFYYGIVKEYIYILIIEALIAWGVSIAYERINGKSKKYVLLIISFLVIIGLSVFKIGTVITDSIIVPVGVSFYSLQVISYLLDLKNEKIRPEKNFFSFMTYISFFPTITSGPIYRYIDWKDNFERNKAFLKPDYERITNGIIYMIYGYFLKLVIAERAAIPVNAIFDGYQYLSSDYDGLLLFVIAVVYSVQIYADFAGYSAIVIGIAQILGYDIQDNFKAPYMAQNIKEFWGRWHVSLSSWLKEYVYIPLGGNRVGKIRKYINILITFFISGLWHGCKVHFIIWGISHGVYQIISDLTKNIRNTISPKLGIINGNYFSRTLNRVITFLMVTFAWIFFRTGTGGAIKYIIKIFTNIDFSCMTSGTLMTLGLKPSGWFLLFICVMFVMFYDSVYYRSKKRFDVMVQSQGSMAKCVTIIVMVLTILIFGIYGDQHDASYFVYRDF